MESMSPYARQFVEQLPRPALDRLTGIPPAVAIEQRVTRGSLKSTVATITEVAQYLRLLYARLGVQHHPDTDRPVTPLSPGALKKLLARVLGTAARGAAHLYLCAPSSAGARATTSRSPTGSAGRATSSCGGRQAPRVDAFQEARPLQGARHRGRRVRPEGVAASRARPSTEALAGRQGVVLPPRPGGRGPLLVLDDAHRHRDRRVLSRARPQGFLVQLAAGLVPGLPGPRPDLPWMLEPDDEDERRDPLAACASSASTPPTTPAGRQPCPECGGERLNRVSRAVKLHFSGPAPRRCPCRPSCAWRPQELCSRPGGGSSSTRGAGSSPRTSSRRSRSASSSWTAWAWATCRSTGRPKTLSGGEAQRIRLAAQLGTNLAGVLYVLDEPSIGLHARDNGG
jgi:excinuclease ABC subunit A